MSADDDRWELAYWESLAVAVRPRAWLSKGWPHWRRLVGIGSDEWHRTTVWAGPLVVALWSCRCADCRAYRARLDQIVRHQA